MDQYIGPSLADVKTGMEADSGGLKGPEPDHLDKLTRWAKSINIATELDDAENPEIPPEVLTTLGMRVKREYNIDETSRADWKVKTEEAMKLAMQHTEIKTYPWPKACFSLDTDILTKNGWKPVADVQIGESVFSRSMDGSVGYYPVSQTFRYRAEEVVHFDGKSIDLLVTPNHRMLVEDRDTGEASFIEAGEFVNRTFARKSIPLTSTWVGDAPEQVYGIDAKAYARFLGWYVAEGSAGYCRNRHINKHGENIDYGLSPSSFQISQSKRANPKKYEQIRKDIEDCGFTYKAYERCFVIHARSMPDLFKAELRSMGKVYGKNLPRHVLNYATPLLEQLLETMIAGDGHSRQRRHQTAQTSSYFTTSWLLADQVQEICQKIGMRGTIAVSEARVGGVINGRQISGAAEGYSVSINRKPSIQVLKLKRELIPYNEDVACVEVYPHHTLYVRRNGKAVWVGNSNVLFPLMTTAAMQFAARAYPAIVMGREIVKGVVIGQDNGTPVVDPQTGQPQVQPGPPGPDGQPVPMPVWQVPPGAKQARADKIGEHMSYQLLDEQPEWEGETDKLLHILPIVGSAFRKSFFDAGKGRNSSLMVSALKLVINYHAKSLETAPRLTEEVEFYPLDIENMERSGEFRKITYTSAQAQGDDKDAPIQFLEQHRWWDLDEDGYPEPYIVTIEKQSTQVVRLVARFDIENVHWNATKGRIQKIDPTHYYTPYEFFPNPEGGIYGVGFGQLLKPINEAVNTTLNMMLDAGHLQVVGGGFVGKGLSMNSGAVRFQPGEWKPVNSTGGTIKDNMVPLPAPGPSPILFQLLGMLVEAGKEVASIKDVLTGEALPANTPATTMLAMVEQGLKQFTAIFKRVHRSLKQELAKLYRLNRIYLEQEASYKIGNEWKNITRADYEKGSGVEPISDPTMVSDMQKLGRAQLVMSVKDDPMIQKKEALTRFFKAANIENIDVLINPNPPPNPLILEKMQSLALRERHDRALITKEEAQALLYRAQAINQIAQADLAVGQQDVAWSEHQLEVIKAAMEAMAPPDQGQQPSQGQPNV